MPEYPPFKFCPSCGRAKISRFMGKAIRCAACGYTYFQNCAAAVSALIVTPQGLLLTRRKSAPRRGFLDLPGGFVDSGESLEGALRREVREELRLEIAGLRYLGSSPNVYVYRKVTYFTTDAFFACRPVSLQTLRPGEEVSSVVVRKPEEIDLSALAFESSRRIIGQYREQGVRPLPRGERGRRRKGG